MSADEPGVEPERDPARLIEAATWFAGHTHENLGPEMLVHRPRNRSRHVVGW